MLKILNSKAAIFCWCSPLVAAFEFLLVSVRFEIKKKILFREKKLTVTYPGRLGAQYTGLGTQTLALKKVFLTFYLKIFFKHPQRRVCRYSIYII